MKKKTEDREPKLEPRPDDLDDNCPVCGKMTAAWDEFWKPLPCSDECAKKQDFEAKRRKIAEGIREAGIPLRFREAEPGQFPADTWGKPKKGKDPYIGASALVTGGGATGKSHFAAAIALNEIRTNPDRTVAWVNATEMLMEFNASLTSDEEDADHRFLDHLISFDLVVIDDLIDEAAGAMAYVVINKRYEWMKRTIVTTPMSLEEIKKHHSGLARKVAQFKQITLKYKPK